MRAYTEREIAKAIATVVVSSRTDGKNKNLGAGAKHVGKLLGVDSAEVERMTAEALSSGRRRAASA